MKGPLPGGSISERGEVYPNYLKWISFQFIKSVLLSIGPCMYNKEQNIKVLQPHTRFEFSAVCKSVQIVCQHPNSSDHTSRDVMDPQAGDSVDYTRQPGCSRVRIPFPGTAFWTGWILDGIQCATQLLPPTILYQQMNYGYLIRMSRQFG